MWKWLVVCALAVNVQGATLAELHELCEETVDAFEGVLPTGDHVVEQLYFTAVVESSGGKHDKQIGGSAVSYFQIEEATANDIYRRYLTHRKGARTALLQFAGVSHQTAYENPLKMVQINPRFAAGIARLVYALDKNPIPVDNKDRATYWKRAYQKGGLRGLSAEQAEKNFKDFCRKNAR
jgi:hypothetical protein